MFHSSSPFSIVFLQSTIAFLSGIFLTVPKQPLLLALSYNNPIPHYCFHSLFLFFRLIEAWGPQLGAGGSMFSLSTQPTPRSWSAVPCASARAVCHRRRGSPRSPTSIVYLLCRSRRNLSKCRAAMNQVFDANKKQPHGTKHLGALQAKKEKKKKEKTEKEKDAAVKNTNIGSSRNPPYCIHYYNLLICSGLMLSILRLSWISFPSSGKVYAAVVCRRWLQKEPFSPCLAGRADCCVREPAIKMNKDPFVNEKEEKKIGLFPPFPSSLAMKKI